MAPKGVLPSQGAGSATKKARKSITLEQKMEVLDRYKMGQKTSVIVHAMGIGESTLRTIRNNGDKIRASVKVGSTLMSKTTSYSRPQTMEKMEKMLSTWIDHQNKSNVPVSMSLLQAKAKSIYSDIEGGDKKTFNASSGWFANFRKRYGYHNIKMTGEAASADKKAASGYKMEEVNENSKSKGEFPFTSIEEIFVKEEPLDFIKEENPFELESPPVEEEELWDEVGKFDMDPFESAQYTGDKEEDCKKSDMDVSNNSNYTEFGPISNHKVSDTSQIIIDDSILLIEKNEETLLPSCHRILIPKQTEITYKCGVCSFHCSNKDDLMSHLRNHFAKEKGPKKVGSKSHQNSVTTCKRKNCNYCNTMPSGNDNFFNSTLKELLEQSHGKKYNLLKCGYCPFTTLCKSALREHMRSCSGSKKFKCKVCLYSTAHKGQFNRHRQTHSKEKKYICHLCSFATAERCNLKYHIKLHEDGKFHNCKFCSFSCKRKYEIEVHMLSHKEKL